MSAAAQIDEAPTWKHPDLIRRRTLQTANRFELREDAQTMINAEITPSPEEARAGQVRARTIGDDQALALWSRLRVRALKLYGSRELLHWR